MKLNFSEDEKALIWLDYFDFMSYKKKQKLLSMVESPQELLRLSTLEDLKEDLLLVLTVEEFSILKQNASLEFCDKILEELNKKDIVPVSVFCPLYPDFLKNTDDPPFVLYSKGNLELLKSQGFAVVGSRHITNYGKQATEKFVKGLVDAGFTIISGLASGVDTVAHTVALLEKGKTIAVLAGGFDNIYPPTNTHLAQQIVSNDGLLLSEVRPSRKTESYMFPIRNRIISGLSRGIVVTEAQEKSGVIHTKNYALDFGRDVFAVPGSIFSLTSAGSNRMIVNGQAKAVIDIDDILSEYDLVGKKKPKKIFDFSIEESFILEALQEGEKSFQDLVFATKYDAKKLNSLLTTLVIRGIIKKLAGNIYILAD